MTDLVYKLENFDTPLENSRICFLLGAAGAQLPGIASSLFANPRLSSCILIASQRSVLPLFFKATWDAVFYADSGKTWSQILTYCSYAAKPSLIVIEDGVTVPDAFIGRLPRENLQLVICRGLADAAGKQLGWVDTIFLPLVEDLAGADADACVAVLNAQLGDNGVAASAALEYKRAWLREVRSAKACLVWTRVGERTARGAVYWLDPADGDDCGISIQMIGRYMKAMSNQLMINIK
jgi:hypothetical protein